MTICACGCGREVPQHEGKGRVKRYTSDTCRQRAHRASIHRDMLALENVTKLPAQSIKPILKYPGAKWNLAQWITSFFPTHRRYLEPYCGSAAVFFNKAPSVHEVLGDTNRSIINLFEVIRDHGEELAWRIEMTPWSEECYHEYEKHYDDTGNPIEDARRFLVRCWQAHGGTIYQVSGWKHNGLHGKVYPTQLWKKLPERLLAVVNRLKNAEIRNRPALDLIASYDAPDTLIYCDPPYVLATRARKYYKHEMTDNEHLQLLDALDRHSGFVILSGYAHPLYDDRLRHWYRVSTPSVTEHGNTRNEVLWLNPKAARGITRETQRSLFDESEATA